MTAYNALRSTLINLNLYTAKGALYFKQERFQEWIADAKDKAE